MKKLICLIFMLVICLSLVGCDKNENIHTNNQISPPTENEYQEKFYSANELQQYLTTVEITAENWGNYFEIKEIEAMKTDPLGEETGYREIDWYIAFKDDSWEINEPITFKFTYNEAKKMIFTNQKTGETRVEPRYDGTKFDAREDFETISSVDDMPKWYKDIMYEWDWWCEENEVNETSFTITDFKCIGARGSLGKCNIPNKLWTVGENGNRYLLVGSPESCVQVNDNENLFRSLKSAIETYS